MIRLLDTAKACSFAGITAPATWFLGCCGLRAEKGADGHEESCGNAGHGKAPPKYQGDLDRFGRYVEGCAFFLAKVWVLLQRRQRLWRGALYLSVSAGYWEEWARSRLVLVAHAKGDPRTCPLAALPLPACEAIRNCDELEFSRGRCFLYRG
eukprot:Skav214159  [mRNA]  locus=scaffold945:118884:123031:- [translate_table: standard]